MATSKSIFVCLLITLILSSCQNYQGKKEENTTDSSKVGTYSLFQSDITDSKGKRIPLLLKLDSKTGDTWLFKYDTTQKWIYVGEDIDPLGIMSPQERKAAHDKKIKLNY